MALISSYSSSSLHLLLCYFPHMYAFVIITARTPLAFPYMHLARCGLIIHPGVLMV
jgi:hypothetical protein